MKVTKKTLERARTYQFVIDGETKLLADMTHEEALRALMQTMDMMEKFEDKLADMSEMWENWCSGDE